MRPHEQLRYLLGANGLEYVVYWRLANDQRSLDLAGSCCSGTIVQNHLEANFNSSAHLLEETKCPDIAIQHLKTKVCEFLLHIPLSIPVDSGLHGQVFFTGQPQLIKMTNSEACALNEISTSKLYFPIPTGLLELGLSSQALDNPSLLQSVTDKCGDLWMRISGGALHEIDGAMLQGQQLQTNDIIGSLNTSGMVVNVPECPLTSGFVRELQNLQGIVDDTSSVRKYQANLGASSGNGDSRGYHYSMYPAASSHLPWTPSTDLAAWGHEVQVNDTHHSFAPGSQPLQFSDPQVGQISSSSNQKQRADIFEGIGDSLHQDRSILQGDQSFPEITFPMANYSQQKAPFLDSPRASVLSKEVSDKDVKQEMRAESSDCSDQMEDDEDKGVARSGRRHLSKNLVAERKRRKKLNERLYSLRALVPKITKMDRASILGDAIEYVKELQKQVKELQDELLEQAKEEEIVRNSTLQMPSDDLVGHHSEETGVHIRSEDGQCSLNGEKIKLLGENNEKGLEDLSQPMQVEVSKIDGQLFSLRIFCVKRPGIFVKLMQALNVLGLDVLHANITTFQGLVLNVFNAETRDNDLLQAEQVRDSLMEMASLCDSCTNCMLNDIPPNEKNEISSVNM
ncbi:hypothetical protein KP509_15G077800 [Ceratopteris richardii]|nr:hypothetical protein KP509_15G077800 [Ceratopteris richardii]KAH7405617.1 hypothetical protein KP509_15G077800 [Ceratopteris richardii]KAH7405618.1 hypothetical protein KP509_15G077800 [Ceratopteris richardii]